MSHSDPCESIRRFILDRAYVSYVVFFFQAEDGIRDKLVTGVQTCALPISARRRAPIPRRAARSSRRPPHANAGAAPAAARPPREPAWRSVSLPAPPAAPRRSASTSRRAARSEERRVGKEGRSRVARVHVT